VPNTISSLLKDVNRINAKCFKLNTIYNINYTGQIIYVLSLLIVLLNLLFNDNSLNLNISLCQTGDPLHPTQLPSESFIMLRNSILIYVMNELVMCWVCLMSYNSRTRTGYMTWEIKNKSWIQDMKTRGQELDTEHMTSRIRA
jgi:hypothetical protein